jgi:hypothetical protein
MTTNHTPTPWRVTTRDAKPATAFDTYAEGSDCSSLSGIIESVRGTFIADTQAEGRSGHSKIIALRNAEFIVTACNAYDAHVARIAELEAVLREVISEPDDGWSISEGIDLFNRISDALEKGEA